MCVCACTHICILSLSGSLSFCFSVSHRYFNYSRVVFFPKFKKTFFVCRNVLCCVSDALIHFSAVSSTGLWFFCLCGSVGAIGPGIVVCVADVTVWLHCMNCKLVAVFTLAVLSGFYNINRLILECCVSLYAFSGTT